MTITNQRLVEILTTAIEKPEITNALIQRVINTLNQQGQETIAKWIKANTEHREWYICPKCSHQAPRFKDEWQGLTDEEIKEIVGLWGDQPVKGYTRKLFDQIEEALRRKNT